MFRIFLSNINLLLKWNYSISNIIFWNFNIWRITLQSTPFVMCNPTVGAINSFSWVGSSIFNKLYIYIFQLDLLWIILCQTSIVVTIAHLIVHSPNVNFFNAMILQIVVLLGKYLRCTFWIHTSFLSRIFILNSIHHHFWPNLLQCILIE